MSRILTWIKEELLSILPAVVFFFVAFNAINLTTELMVKKEGFTIATLSTIAVGSLVVGKVMLIIDSVPFIDAFSNKPLVYNTLWKTMIYSLAGLAFRLVEILIPLIVEHKKLAPAYRDLLVGTDWPRFWAVQIWVVLLFFFFVLSQGFIQAIGRERVRQLFFGR
jgi:hypothetical protein